MATSTFKGSFACNTSTGNQSITGVGFQPIAVLFWGVTATAAGYTANKLGHFVGAATSTTARWAMASCSDDAAASSNTGRSHITSGCIQHLSAGTPTVDSKADLVSLDSDGFTINWSDAPGSAWIVHYLAIGGSSVTNAKAGYVTVTAGTGSKAFTGVGFAADMVIHVENGLTNIDTTGTGANVGFGAFTSSTNAESAWADRDGQATMATRSYQRSDKAVAQTATSSEAINLEGTLTSMDSDGFTINFTTVGGQTIMAYLALKGGNYKVGVDTQPSGTGNDALTGLGFKPSGLIFAGVNQTSSTSLNSTAAKLSMFATDGTNQGGVWIQSADNVADSAVDQRSVTTAAMAHSTQASTTNAEATIASMDTDGYTLNWGTADATAREYVYIAIGPAANDTPTPGGGTAGGVGATAKATVATGGGTGGGVAPTTKATVPQGGATAGGVAAVVRADVTPGGGTAGGVAPTARVDVATGGGVGGGVAPTEFYYQAVTPGGGTAGGVAPTAVVSAAAGGGTAGGNAATVQSAVTPGGGAAGGVEAVARVDVATGGATAGGVAPGEIVGDTTPTPGGGVAGGVEPVARVDVATGGATAGGVAAVARADVTPGGGTAGGVAPTARVDVATGGGTGGGVSPTDSFLDVPTPGGGTAGGVAPTARVDVSAGGGVAGGVEPTAPYTESPTPGGGSAGGVSPTAAVTVVAGGAVGVGVSPVVRVIVGTGGARCGGDLEMPSQTSRNGITHPVLGDGTRGDQTSVTSGSGRSTTTSVTGAGTRGDPTSVTAGSGRDSSTSVTAGSGRSTTTSVLEP